MTVLDLGCGPGFFSVEIARMLYNSGKVIAADLQEGILNIVRNKLKGTELEQKVILHKCNEENIGITEKVDFILAFYMIHEVPDQHKLFRELKSIIKPKGQIFIIEPKFHVSKKSFSSMAERIVSLGFDIEDSPEIFFSRTVLLRNLD